MLDLVRVLANILNTIVDIPVAATISILSLFAAVAGGLYVVLATSLFTGLGLALVVVALLLLLILAILILVTFFIVIYKLLTRYVIFLLLAMFAPVFFLVGAIPGMEGAIYTWFKRAFAALIAIPITGIVIRLAFAIGFSGVGGVDESSVQTIADAAIPIPGLDMIGGALGGALNWVVAAPIVGLGLFFFSTKVPDMVDDLLGNRGGGGGRRGGGMIGGIIGMPMGAMQTASNLGRAWTNTRAMREAGGSALRNIGWGRTAPTQAVPGGMAASRLSPDWRKALQDQGMLQGNTKLKGGIPESQLSSDWAAALDAQGLLKPPPGGVGERVTVAGRVGPLETAKGEVRQVALPKEGGAAETARRILNVPGAKGLFGVKTPPRQPVFKTAEKVADEKKATRAAIERKIAGTIMDDTESPPPDD